MVANILPTEPPPRPWGIGPKLRIQLIQIIVAIANQIKWNQAAPPPPPTLGVGSKVRNSTFSEHGQVAYQIKGNHECSVMVANILPTDPHPHHPDPGVEVKKYKFNFFRTWVCCISN